MSAGLRSADFRRERAPAWRDLDALVTRVEKDGLHTLGPEELTRLPMLYRQAISSLSVARAISLDRNVLDYLESLTQRAYLCVYGPKRNLFEALGTFFSREMPRTVRAHGRYILIAALVMLAGTVTAFALTQADPSYFHAFVDDDYAKGRGPDASTAELRSVLYGMDETAAESLTAFALYLFQRNAGIGILCFALGFAAGLPTLILLFMNGLVLGAFWGLYHQRGLGLDLWAWVLPHGVPEIFAVILCGAAGLSVARAVLLPGRRSRRASLAEGGRGAARVVAGAVALFLYAGLVEGVFRQTVQSLDARLALSAVNAAWLAFWLLRAGRGAGPDPTAEDMP